MKPQYEKFLEGLRKLSLETGVIVNGCGCCDSPYLMDLKESQLHPEGKYEVYGDDDDDMPPGNLNWEYPTK